MSLADDIYSALYDLAMGALNPGYDPGADPENPTIPAVPIVQDQQSQAAPTTGVYVSISGSPSLQRMGTVEIDVPEEGATVTRGLEQLYTGTVTLWEVNGNGSKLQAIFDYSDTEAGEAILDATPVSILSYGDIVDVAYKIDNRWIAQSRAALEVSIKAKSTESVGLIEEVQWANAETPTSIQSVVYPIP